MQIQMNTDNHISSSDPFLQGVPELLNDKLRRFQSRITRLEVHLTDENSADKEGDDDIRCQLEARLNGLQPISVSERNGTIAQSVNGAIKKLQSKLESTLGKLDKR